MSKINAGVAMVNVLEAWDIDHIYGIPGGSFNSTMDALYHERESVKYIQVRHEEAGALAAAADAKLTGKVGAVFGSAGPGASHLINGLYDAQMDHVPVLALLGQVASTAMNYNAFQELNENPMFADVSVYNRTVMTAESLPHVIDEAIKAAYQQKGVAVVTIPVDLGFAEIEETEIATAKNHKTGVLLPDEADLKAALPLIEAAKQPVLYIGQGVRGGFDAIKAFAEHFSMPVAAAVLAKGIVPDLYENFLGFAARVATKPANEALADADLIVFVGSDFPFGRYFFNPDAKFIQVDIDAAKFGRRHQVDQSVLGDGATALRRWVELGNARPADAWLKANQENIRNWHAWRKSFYNDDSTPLRAEPVFKEVNRIAEQDAVYVADVGNVTLNAIRHLEMNGEQQFTTSGWFATMGNGVPGGIAAQLTYPEKQVFTFSGDGGFAMQMQDIITQVKYNLPIINVVFSNNAFGFIEAEQEDTEQQKFGVFLEGADFGKVGEALGADGFTITEYSQLEPAFTAAKASKRPVVIDVKIKDERPLPVEALELEPDKFSEEQIKAFKEKYQVHDMPTLRELLK
ncbi:pyruvate oxidase [Enterococcus raffinosus]|uniref:Pyruvate oxidase n=2 Tax=Enterococcus raffinosus TaxID=71452 RepID=A0AAW8T0Q7_9ENTE|nr:MULTISPECIES: pyruvate oxidase [Enterococcus]MBS6430729.1 pyruvate oxidase [Enterococcus raffinosus]MBX9039469.1 pyruvate oxidase [Enterococcus raffinosus]MDK7990513.1 pyruvate oxidase [Enterococcus raffinosus]MDT2538504.1 pyruvate oxidase [Enterococcus raffinosus]MDU6577894.1 pyruvate oxidase [Enterococcus raffinosus]